MRFFYVKNIGGSMWTTHPARQLARARLEIPCTAGGRCDTAALVIDASIRAHSDGELVVALRTESGGPVRTLPLLAFLQFISRFEDAAYEALAADTSRDRRAEIARHAVPVVAEFRSGPRRIS